MASSSSSAGGGGGGGGGNLFRKENKINPFEIIGITTDTSFKDAHRQYLKQMKKHHSDKNRGDDAFTKLLTQAWKLINDTSGDAEEMSQLAKEFFSADGATASAPEDIDLDKVLADKTKSTEFRAAFQTIFDQKEKYQFRESYFYAFYGQIFSKVETHKDVKPQLKCEVCDGEEFISVEDHSKAVFYPYYDFVMASPKTRVGLEKYMENLFGQEAFSMKIVDHTISVSNETDRHFTMMMQSLQNYKQSGQRTHDLIQIYAALCNKANRIQEIMEDVTRNDFQAVLEAISYHENGEDAPSVMKQHCVCEALLPALLKTIRHGFKGWGELAIKIYDEGGFHDWAIVFCRAAMYLGDENACVKLGDHLVGKDDKRADQCYFKVGSCDANLIGHQLAKKGKNKMAAQYLLKTRDLKALWKYGEKRCLKGDRQEAAMFLVPLILYHLREDGFNEAIQCLKLLMPTSMFFRSVQELATKIEVLDDQVAFYECEGIANAVIGEVERICRDTLLGKVPDIITDGDGPGLLSMETDDRLVALNALSGALHVLHCTSLKNCTDPNGICERLLAPLLSEALCRKQIELVLILSKCPGMNVITKRVLSENGMFPGGQNQPERKFTPGQLYGSGLLLLRAIINYKSNQISAMLRDLDRAYMLAIGHSSISEPIATFLVTTPMVQKKIIGTVTNQFLKLRKYFENRNMCEFPESQGEHIFSDLMSNTGFFSHHLNLAAIFESGKGPNLELVEQKILVNDSDANKKKFIEIGMHFVDLAEIASGMESTICCYVQAIAHFYKAIMATEDPITKYAYLKLIEKVVEELEPYTMVGVTGPYLCLYALRAKLSFLMRAHLHVTQAIRKMKQESTFVEYLGKWLFSKLIFNPITVSTCGNEEDIPSMAKDWQTLLNLSLLCPVSTPEIYSVADGNLALCLGSKINNKVVLMTVEENEHGDQALSKGKRFTCDHHLFNELWRERLAAENFYRRLPNFKEDSNLPVLQTRAFRIAREQVMQSAAKLYSYDLKEVENMMNWHRIRRSLDGFVDTGNRTLNFDGEKTYSRLNAVQIDLSSGEYSLLLQVEHSGENQPGLFGWTDIAESFGHGICGAVLSFEEEKIGDRMENFEKVELPFSPFFKVEFKGIGPDGNASKERICGTNFLMTLYHADLLAKILTTGQEVGAAFPFPYKHTQTGLLANLPKKLAKILEPIGPRKQAQKIRRMENIHLFWFHVKEVEQETETDTTKGEITIRFGRVVLELRVMRMMVDKNGKLINAEHLLDPESPEVKFVRGFNENIEWIMEYFPILRRLKELAKISLCYQLLYINKANFTKADANFNRIFSNFSLPNWRPYSECVTGEKCKCCDWVPAVFHEMAVTGEQKLNYLFGKAREIKDKAITGGGDQAPMLTFGIGGSTTGGTFGKIPNQQQQKYNDKKDEPKNPPRVNMKDYDLVEKYKIYGGVCFVPVSKSVTGMPPNYYQERVDLSRSYGSSMSAYGKTGYQAAAQTRSAASSSSSSGGTSGGGGWDGGNNNNNGKPKKGLPTHDPFKKNIFPEDNVLRGHIFRNKQGHYLNSTGQARKQLTDLANNETNYVGTDVYQKRWYAKMLTNGEQQWAYTQNNVIWDGGKNAKGAEREFDYNRGMIPKKKPT